MPSMVYNVIITYTLSIVIQRNFILHPEELHCDIQSLSSENPPLCPLSG